MNDEGNTVVSSKKWGSYIENDTIGEKIMIERVGDTFEMTLKAKKNEGRHSEGVARAEDGGKKYEGLVDANDEHCYYYHCYYYLFLSWAASPQQLLTSNPCPTTPLLKCKGPEKTLHRAINGVHTTTNMCHFSSPPPHNVLHRPNLQQFTCISSREYDEMEGCSSSQF